MPSSFGTIYKAAHPEFVRKVSDETTKKRRLLREIKKRGQVTYGHDGTKLDWRARYKEHDLSQYVDGGIVKFKRIDPYIQAELPYIAYDMNTTVTKKERFATQGKSAIFNLYRQKTKEIRDDIRKKFSTKLWAAGGGGEIQGLLAALSGTFAAGAVAGTADGTYAGISQVLGANGGSSGDPEYDFWTPTLINWASTAWVASGVTFVDTAGEALRRALIDTSKENDEEEMVDCVFLSRLLYISFLEYMAAKETIFTTKGAVPGGTTEVGFRRTIMFDGVPIEWEHDISDNEGYGINFDKLHLEVQDKTLFGGEMEYDIDSKAWKMDVDFFGQLRIESPRHFFRLSSS